MTTPVVTASPVRICYGGCLSRAGGGGRRRLQLAVTAVRAQPPPAHSDLAGGAKVDEQQQVGCRRQGKKGKGPHRPLPPPPLEGRGRDGGGEENTNGRVVGTDVL
jgi:hypothetical protein